jgi:hypothetical protein
MIGTCPAADLIVVKVSELGATMMGLKLLQKDSRTFQSTLLSYATSFHLLAMIDCSTFLDR